MTEEYENYDSMQEVARRLVERWEGEPEQPAAPPESATAEERGESEPRARGDRRS